MIGPNPYRNLYFARAQEFEQKAADAKLDEVKKD